MTRRAPTAPPFARMTTARPRLARGWSVAVPALAAVLCVLLACGPALAAPAQARQEHAKAAKAKPQPAKAAKSAKAQPEKPQSEKPQPAKAPAKPRGELVFGMSAAFSGSARGLGVEYYRGIMAGFEQVNAQGGAGGWKLKLSLQDDSYDPVPALGNTIRFVEEERVFALLGYVGTPTTARVLPLLMRYEGTGMALLFPLTGANNIRELPHSNYVFNLRASYLDETRHLVESLLAAGRRRIAVFHQADIYGRNGWDGVRRTLRARNMVIVGEATYRRGATYSQDFRREVGIIAQARPDAVITVGTAPACAAFIRDARNEGLAAPIAALSFADADNLVKFLLAQTRVSGRDYISGLVFSQVVPCYEDTTLPGVRQYRLAMERAPMQQPAGLRREEYLPQKFSFVSFEGYLASQVLAEAVRRIADAPSRQRLRDVLLAMRGYDLGICEKVSFGSKENQGLTHTYLTVYRGGRFQGVQGLEGVLP